MEGLLEKFQIEIQGCAWFFFFFWLEFNDHVIRAVDPLEEWMFNFSALSIKGHYVYDYKKIYYR